MFGRGNKVAGVGTASESGLYLPLPESEGELGQRGIVAVPNTGQPEGSKSGTSSCSFAKWSWFSQVSRVRNVLFLL